MLPKARTDGDGYSDEEDSEGESEGGEDESMDMDEDQASQESEDDGPKAKVAGKKSSRLQKTIQKRKEGKGRYKANGNRKTRDWILKKKDR
jgi:hypothetical protein